MEELRNVCLWLAQKVQETEPQITRDSDGEMIFSTDAGKNAVRAMQELGEDYRELKGYYPQPKSIDCPGLFIGSVADRYLFSVYRRSEL